jgi:hypothetical protein
MSNHYEILGVSQDASPDEIKNRYKTLVLKLHPDKESSSIAREAMVSINNAYEVLSDPKRHLDYDLSLRKSGAETCHKGPQARWSGPYLGKIFNMRRVQVLIVITISISFLTGYQMEIALGDAKSISDQFMRANQHYYTATAHEVLASLPLCIPIFGLAWGVLAGFTTGFLDKAIIVMAPGLPSKVSGIVLPYTILSVIIKLATYYIGMCRSLALASSIRRRRFTKLDRMFTCGDVILVMLLSLLAGFVEHAMVDTG